MSKPNSAFDKVSDGFAQIHRKVNQKVEDIDVEKAVFSASKIPGAVIDRKAYLEKEIRKYYPEYVAVAAAQTTPFEAGVTKECIDIIAKDAIKYETTKATFASTATGLPGGFAMVATVPADVVQYFVFMIRVAQKLAYLYGYPEMNLGSTTDVLDDASMNELLIFLGVMFGVQGAEVALKKLTVIMATNVEKQLVKKALTKGVVYPIVQRIAKTIGVDMTKQVFAKGVGKAVPVVGGVASGVLTFATFKPCCYRLRKELEKNFISDLAYLDWD